MKPVVSVLMLFVMLFSANQTFAQPVPPLQRLQQMVDYIAVDYPGAVENGVVVNAVEYEEMLDFAGSVSELAEKLSQSPQLPAIRQNIQTLKQRIAQKASGNEIAALAAQIRRQLIDSFALAVTPSRLPDLSEANTLFAENCSSCHGATGHGDGPMAQNIDPKPTNFHDLERYRQRTLFGLFSTISLGVEGTAMPAFSQLTDDQRWALAFYTGAMAAAQVEQEAARALSAQQPALTAQWNLQRLTTQTPAEAEAQDGATGAQIMATLRSQPTALFEQKSSTVALAFARDKLKESLRAYAAGQYKQAHELAVTAYLEGFELIEGNLDAIDRTLRLQIEHDMTAFRQAIKKQHPQSELEALQSRIDSALQQAETLLSETLLSPSTAFAGALIIVLREGLEAILVIAALAAFLIKTGRRDGLRYLSYGVAFAFALGGLTWWLSTLVEISGSGREMTEGLAALFAAMMLFYVGFWMHGKTSAAQWQAFIRDNIQRALSRGALWGLSTLAFIAVYREIFESVLFYQALWLQTSEQGHGMIFTGLIVALAVLVLLAWLILRFSTRLPLRQFFAVTAVFMFVLAVVFAGKGVAALQEAGKIPVDLIHFPRIDLLGIYPNLESLGLQLLMLLAALTMYWRNRSTAEKSG